MSCKSCRIKAHIITGIVGTNSANRLFEVHAGSQGIKGSAKGLGSDCEVHYTMII